MVDDSDHDDFTFVDIFAGIGGFHLAFERIGGRCVDAVEYDRFAVKTYNENHTVDGGPIEVRDINEIEPSSIKDHDVLFAGSPCQPFSLAGVSKKNSLGRGHGFDDEHQGNLFEALSKVIDAKRPAVFVLENVKHLRAHDRGRTFATIESILDKLDYSIDYQVVDARQWVPQMRKRILIVGFDKRLRIDRSFSFDHLYGKGVPDTPPTLDAVLHKRGRPEPEWDPYAPNGFVKRRYNLSEHLWTYLQEYKEKHERRGNGFGFGLVGRNDVARTLSARYHKDGAEILVKRSVGQTPRRLTPRECARLMGYPDGFRITVSDTQAYRQFGNSIVVPMMTSLAWALRPDIIRFAAARVPKRDPAILVVDDREPKSSTAILPVSPQAVRTNR
jgi:DNA (cytosine-5)-methyltransferase 1